ncbi:F-box/LRR-repeat protein 7-like [Lytechinus pictus]|uniref:F-box/LRR-repeat protein 7-like n=1 Tax=Lytechinus pictus TaxID=7653 RepID=UPI0030B9C405
MVPTALYVFHAMEKSSMELLCHKNYYILWKCSLFCERIMLKFVISKPAPFKHSLKLENIPNGSISKKLPPQPTTPNSDIQTPESTTKSSLASNRSKSPTSSAELSKTNSSNQSPSESNYNGNNNAEIADVDDIVRRQEEPSSRTLDVQRPSPFDRLTDSVITHMFSYLSTKQLCRCSCVSRRWHRLAWQPMLWTTIRLSGRRLDVNFALRVLVKRLSRETPYLCLSVGKLVLNGCHRLSDKTLELIAHRCPELLHVELMGCHLISNAAIFQIVSRCPNLDYLDISGCKQVDCMNLPVEPATSDPKDFLKQRINLRHLDMSDCSLLDDNGLRTIATNCPTLVNLYLRRCIGVTDIGVQYVTTQCLMLKEVSLSDCPRVTDCAMRELAKLEYHLRYLSVAKCELVTDMGVYAIAKHCYKLRYLNVRGCVLVSDKSLEALSRGCSRLRSLDAGKCPLITDHGLVSIATNCQSLRKLSLKGCLHVTDQVIEVLAQVCPDLQQLNIQDCDEVSREAYRLLKRCCRKCIIEHTNPAFY